MSTMCPSSYRSRGFYIINFLDPGLSIFKNNLIDSYIVDLMHLYTCLSNHICLDHAIMGVIVFALASFVWR
jgi:hypothetical protein